MHLEKGIGLLPVVSDTQERAHQQFLLQLALGAARMATEGYAAPEVARLYEGAQALGQQWEAIADPLPVLSGLWALHVTRAELERAQQLAMQLHIVAQQRQAPALFLAAYQAEGYTAYYTGDFLRSEQFLEQSLAFYDPSLLQTFSQYLASADLKADALSTIAWSQWMRGYPQQALATAQEALTRARELGHPLSLVSVLYRTARLHQFRGELGWTVACAEETLQVARQHDLVLFAALAMIFQGWGLALRGQWREGLALMEKAMATYQAAGTALFRPYLLALGAEVAWRGGQSDRGLVWITEAHELTHTTGEHHYDAELHRLKGELVRHQKPQPANNEKQKVKHVIDPRSLSPGPHVEAEGCFRRALEIAREQGAKSLELRATTSLARLWQRQGKTVAAGRMLRDCYASFTEGFDTKDLQDAKAVLNELT